MYLSHFNLDREPFHITPDPHFFYLGPSHKESLASLIYGLKNRKGFVSLTGEVGLGKTTVVRAFLNKWSSKAKIKTVFVFHSNLSFKGLLVTIFTELGLDLPGQKAENGQAAPSEQDQIFDLVQALYRALIQEFEQGYNVILVIDEAQNMPLQTLENLRMLSNLETSQNKLLQIFLIGQTELDHTLDRKELRQLRQRIAIRATLRPLTAKQSKDYIHHRLQKAGAQGKTIFTPGALRKIHKYAHGVPRKINILADNALITGFGYGHDKIGSKIIQEVQADLEGKTPGKAWKIALACLVVFTLLGTGLWFSPYKADLLAALQSVAHWGPTHNTPPPTDKKQTQPRASASESGLENALDLEQELRPLHIQVQRNADSQPTPTPGNDPAPQTEEPDAESVSQEAASQEGPPQEVPEAEQEQPQEAIAQEQPEEQPAGNQLPLPPEEHTEENIFIHNQLAKSISAYSELSPTRQLVLIRMAKQTSINGLLGFERMLAALERKDFQEAARQMLYSRWARSVGEEAEELAEVMRKGNKQ